MKPRRTRKSFKQLQLERYEKSEIIFLHIPKTGGTTLIYYFHANKIVNMEVHVYRNQYCLAADILEDLLIGKGKTKKVIIAWRHPIEHTFSSFNFLAQCRDVLTTTTLEDFVADEKYHNMQTGFLNRTKFLEGSVISELDHEMILRLLNRKNTLFVLTEYFQEGIRRIKEFVGLKDELHPPRVRRFNFNKPPSFLLPDKVKENILKYNTFDLDIYNRIIQQYNYTEEFKEDPMDIEICKKDIPDYFPYIWFHYSDIKEGCDYLHESKNKLVNIHEEICNLDKAKDEITVREYVSEWIHRFYGSDNRTSMKSIEDIGIKIDTSFTPKFYKKTKI